MQLKPIQEIENKETTDPLILHGRQNNMEKKLKGHGQRTVIMGGHLV